MSIGNIFDVAASAMSAQGIRLNTVASNLANAEVASGSAAGAYRARHPVFAPLYLEQLGAHTAVAASTAGVQVLGIVQSDAPPRARHEPHHPLADAEGYVYYPNVDVVEEMADMISASRAFQVNVQLVEAAAALARRVLALGQ